MQEGGDAEEPTPLSEAERRDGATPRGDEVPSYSARGRGGDHGPKQKQRAAARAASGAERILQEMTWTPLWHLKCGHRVQALWHLKCGHHVINCYMLTNISGKIYYREFFHPVIIID